MGLQIDREHFDAADFAAFSTRLNDCLNVLGELIERPGFGAGPISLGAELEVSIVDRRMRALALDQDKLPQDLDEHITLELNRFNLEYNLDPLVARGRPFSALARQLVEALATLDRSVASQRGRAVPIGILPTLRPSDLESHAMTDMPRFRALSVGLRRERGRDFQVDISGEDPLRHSCDEITLEGAGTSFQLHLRVEPARFAALYNACQLATIPALAISGNSPIFLEHRLWDETRVALFKQAIDPRSQAERVWRRPARVSFGHGWLHGGAFELFAEGVRMFPPLLPVCADRDPRESPAAGRAPELAELRLHHSTVWRWNRAVYDPAGGGHLRIELRALPSGPTPVDMAANAAFLLGLAMGLEPDMRSALAALPFEFAQWSFYRAAQDGLDAEIVWPSDQAPSPTPRPARELLPELLPVAARGLDALGVDADEAEHWLGIVRARLAADITPAQWQRRTLRRLEPGSTRRAALAEMMQRYLAGLATGLPLHEWSED